MASLARLRVTWSGSPVVGPGVSTFYFDPADTGASTLVRNFFNAAPLLFPAGLTLTIPSGGEIITDTTGDLSGTWNDPGSGGTVNGANTGDFAKGVGMQVRWQTGGIVGGRRVVGSTFLCPIAGAIFDVDGTVDNASITSTQAAANTMIGGAVTFKVWSRPTASRAGTSNDITSAVVPDRVSWLRSRRT